MINCDKDLFFGWVTSREISALGKNLIWHVKLDQIPVIDSYTLVNLTAILTT